MRNQPAARPLVCLVCGDSCEPIAMYVGAVGPFCSARCRDKQADLKVWERANAYEGRILEARANVEGIKPIEEGDIARAFVIGYAAGLEDGHAAVGRRTVRR